MDFSKSILTVSLFDILKLLRVTACDYLSKIPNFPKCTHLALGWQLGNMKNDPLFYIIAFKHVNAFDGIKICPQLSNNDIVYNIRYHKKTPATKWKFI